MEPVFAGFASETVTAKLRAKLDAAIAALRHHLHRQGHPMRRPTKRTSSFPADSISIFQLIFIIKIQVQYDSWLS